MTRDSLHRSLAFLAALFLTSNAFAQRQQTTALSLVVSPQCAVTGVQQLAATNPGNQSSSRSQSYSFNYRLRTSPGGLGQIVARFASGSPKDFPNGSKIDYQSQFTGPARGKIGTVSTQSALANGIVIGDFGGESHTAKAGATGTFTMTVNPTPAGPFSPLVPTFTITCR